MKDDNVAIIIVNWNNSKDTIECLTSLSSLDYNPYKIFLVDNGSSDNSIEELESFLFKGDYNTELLKSKSNLGFAGGMNIGIKATLEAGYKLFWLLNNDTVVYSGALKHLVDYAKRNEKVGFLGSKQYFYKSTKIGFAGGILDKKTGKAFSVGLDEEDSGQYNEIKSYDYISGCSLLVKKEVIDSVGLMEEGFFLYYEEADWNLRARSAGWECYYIPESIVEHKFGASTEGGYSTPFISYYNLRNRYIMTKRNPDYFTRFGPLLFLLKRSFALSFFAIVRRDKKLERIKYAILGCLHALIGRLVKLK